jgi:hypothetical protein
MKKRHLDVGISFNFFKSHQSSQPRYFAQKINVWFTSSNQRNFAKFSPSFAHYAAIARWRPRRCPTTTASKKMMQELLHLIGARRWEFLRTESILISDPSAMMEAIFNCAPAPGLRLGFMARAEEAPWRAHQDLGHGGVFESSSTPRSHGGTNQKRRVHVQLGKV